MSVSKRVLNLLLPYVLSADYVNVCRVSHKWRKATMVALQSRLINEIEFEDACKRGDYFFIKSRTWPAQWLIKGLRAAFYFKQHSIHNRLRAVFLQLLPNKQGPFSKWLVYCDTYESVRAPEGLEMSHYRARDVLAEVPPSLLRSIEKNKIKNAILRDDVLWLVHNYYDLIKRKYPKYFKWAVKYDSPKVCGYMAASFTLSPLIDYHKAPIIRAKCQERLCALLMNSIIPERWGTILYVNAFLSQDIKSVKNVHCKIGDGLDGVAKRAAGTAYVLSHKVSVLNGNMVYVPDGIAKIIKSDARYSTVITTIHTNINNFASAVFDHGDYSTMNTFISLFETNTRFAMFKVSTDVRHNASFYNAHLYYLVNNNKLTSDNKAEFVDRFISIARQNMSPFKFTRWMHTLVDVLTTSKTEVVPTKSIQLAFIYLPIDDWQHAVLRAAKRGYNKLLDAMCPEVGQVMNKNVYTILSWLTVLLVIGCKHCQYSIIQYVHKFVGCLSNYTMMCKHCGCPLSDHILMITL